MEILRNPRVGEVLDTTVEIKEEIFNSTLVETTVMAGNEAIAKCEMKIYLTDKAPD